MFEKADQGTDTKYALHVDTSNDEVSVQVTDKISCFVVFACLFVFYTEEENKGHQKFV